MSFKERFSQNFENATMELEDHDAGAVRLWSIADNQLDSLNRIPFHVRFTPPVIFDDDKKVIEVKDGEWLKFVEKKSEVCFREGQLRWEHYQSKTKKEEEKRMHYHAIIVSTEDALTKWFQRQGLSAYKSILKSVDPSKNYNLTKCFRYVSKDGDCVVNKGYPVERLRKEYWYVDAEVTAFKESTKKDKKRKFDNWTEELYENVSHTATTQASIGVDIMRYYHKKGRLLPQPYIMGQLTATFVYRNNLKADIPVSEEEMFRRLYPNLA